MTRKPLTTGQVAARLGVKPNTIYAYVSRGVLSRTLADDGRTSHFDPREVERLALRGRPRRGSKPLGRVDVSLATGVTQIDGETVRYRGHDATELASEVTFERAAQLLWTGVLPDTACFARPSPAPKAARTVARALPPQSPAIERFAAVTAALACEQPLRIDLRRQAVVARAEGLIATLIDALPAHTRSKAPPATAPVAARLWQRLSPLPIAPGRVDALNRALVLLADHELATSTLAARVAASTRADPFATVLAGLAAASGPLHGKAASQVHRLLLTAQETREPAEVLLLKATQNGQRPMLAGFSHPVYQAGDPRAPALMSALPRLARKRALSVVTRVEQAAQACLEAPINVDFALGALAFMAEMHVGATDAIFVLARIAGWTAHTLEEYGEAPVRFRARAVYDRDL